jgi:hypothetical protein
MHTVRFYLNDVPTQKIDNAEDRSCFMPGTLLVTVPDRAADHRGFLTIASVMDVDASRFAVIRARPRL